MSETFEGSCECGDIRYRLTSRPIIVNCCHCRDCQTITGSAFALNGMIETDRIRIATGSPHERSLQREGSGDTRAWRCPRCETLLWADHPMVGDAMRFVRLGTLDRGEALPPQAHFFIRSKHPWITLPDGIPVYDTLPPDGFGIELDEPAKARLAAARSDGETNTG